MFICGSFTSHCYEADSSGPRSLFFDRVRGFLTPPAAFGRFDEGIAPGNELVPGFVSGSRDALLLGCTIAADNAIN